jgi:WD40 repeat protein
MYRKKIFRVSAGFVLTVMILSLMSVNVSAGPMRLGSGFVSSIAFSPDGRMLAAAHRTDPESNFWKTQVVILWDTQTHEQVDMLEIDSISVIAFSPDGTLLALGGDDNKIYLWDVAGLNQVGVMQSPTRWGLYCLAFSPDGNTLASSGSRSNLIYLWDVQTQQQAGVLSGHTGRSIHSVAFSPDGRSLASGGYPGDEAIRLWDVQTQEQVGKLIGHLDVTLDLAFSPDGTILASAGGSNDMAVYLWDVEKQNQMGVLGGHSAPVGSIAFSPNGKLLASTVYWDNAVHLWDIERQEQVGVFEGHDAADFGYGDQVAFSSDGKWLACGSENGVELWELDHSKTMLTELILFILDEYFIGNIDADLAWDLLVEVQTALAALESYNPDDTTAAMNKLKTLVDQEHTNNTITLETAAEIVQRANEIIIIVALGG